MKKYWPLLSILVLIVGLALIVPQKHQYDSSSSYSENEGSGDHDWEVRFAGAAAIFSGVLALIGGLQIRETRITAKRQLRAYVSATPLSAALRSDDITMSVSITLKNCGDTPAFKFRSRAGISVMPVPVPLADGLEHLNFFLAAEDIGAPEAEFVIFPGASHLANPIRTFTDEERWQISIGWGIYVSGRVEYTDAFGDAQWTEFCSVLTTPDIVRWAEAAKNEPERKSVPAMFKYTSHNNRASFN